jgi:hypothetical protein
MSHISANTFYLFTALFVIMTCSLSFTVVFSVSRTRPRSEFFFTVEAMAVYTQSLLAGLHPPPAKLSPLAKLVWRTGIGASVILRIK